MISKIYSSILPLFKSGSRKGKKKKDIQASIDQQLNYMKAKVKSKHSVGDKTVLYLQEEEVPYRPKKKVKAKKYFSKIKFYK
jgi:hypothetical protein